MIEEFKDNKKELQRLQETSRKKWWWRKHCKKWKSQTEKNEGSTTKIMKEVQ